MSSPSAASTGTGTSASANATYTSPSSKVSFHHSVAPLLELHAVDEKIIYLSKLGQSVRQLQNDINAFLTERMEEDKKSAEVSVKEAEEEENYGEENVEES